MYLLLTLTQWMKAPAQTLFILSGRPMEADLEESPDAADSIRTELEDSPSAAARCHGQPRRIPLRHRAALPGGQRIAAGLRDELQEKQKLAHLTGAIPLWLAFAVDYLKTSGFRGGRGTLAEIQLNLPTARR